MPERPKKAFYAKGGKLPPTLQRVYERFLDSEASGSPTKVSFKEMVEPYYGDQYQVEVDKANAYLNKVFPLSKTRKGEFNTGSFSRENTTKKKFFADGEMLRNPPAIPVKLKAHTTSGSPTPYHYTTTQLPPNEFIQYGNPSQQKEYAKTGYSLFKDELDTPTGGFMSGIEHEVGHSAFPAMSFLVDSDLAYTNEFKGRDLEDAYIAKSAELPNALGRLTREHYSLTGKRINNETLQELFKSIKNDEIDPENKYSPESQRTLRVLQKSFNKVDKGDLYRAAVNILPGLVGLTKNYPIS